MPIELNCTQCGNRLRVDDEHAGREAECPVCGNHFLIPEVPPVVAPPDEATPQPSAAPTQPSDNPYASPTTAATGAVTGLRPHRGGTILTLGIVSVLCCGVLGLAPLLMGRADLEQMNQGTMDPNGRSLTQAGMILGAVALLMVVAGAVFQVIVTVAG